MTQVVGAAHRTLCQGIRPLTDVLLDIPARRVDNGFLKNCVVLMKPISVSEAADILDVSERQVRRLIGEADLRAQRISGRWVLDEEDVKERARQSPEAGRPLSQATAWRILSLLSACLEDGPEACDWVAAEPDRRVRHHLRQLLVDAPPVDRWNLWTRNKAEPHQVWVHPSLVDDLALDQRTATVNALSAAAATSGVGADVHLRLFVRKGCLADLMGDYRAKEDPSGEVTLLAVDDDVADDVLRPGRGVPIAALLVDLVGSADARKRHEASRALSEAANDLVSDLPIRNA